MLDFENKPFYVGADGCKTGWFAILIVGKNQWQTEVFQNISELWRKFKKASVILIDIPIGIKEEGGLERRCDKEARRIVRPPRASSVFRVPCRKAVYAATYYEANEINERRTGTRISPMTWGIIPKIREMDKFIERNRSALSCVKEIHPELCFWAFAGNPMQHNKKHAEGFKERFQVLKSCHPDTAAIVSYALSNYRRRDVAKDDILDALVAAITAFTGPGALSCLPNPPEFDDRGLPMQMIYRPRNVD
jgi:predicted RNase H-like nuclease